MSGALPAAAFLVAISCISGSLTGCGTPATPQPPSLKLPVPANDLTAARAGDTITLHWTTPRKTTDRLLIQGAVQANVCRIVAGALHGTENCETGIVVQPGAPAEFHAKLPAELLAGEPRVARYFVELRNTHGKSAGPSNTAAILAGAAPAPVLQLSAEARANGVALHWQPDSATSIRLYRTLLTPPAKPTKRDKTADGKKAGRSLMTAAPEPLKNSLWVEAPTSGPFNASLDATAHFGESYSYAAQRVTRITIDGQTLELGGPISEPVRIDVLDRFPPAVPRDLAAVAAVEEKSIDLSWTPDTEADLAGYIVYRRNAEEDSSSWQRISGQQPVVAPAWRDATAAPGHSYRYRVTAIDQTGHESAPSEEAQETLPQP